MVGELTVAGGDSGIVASTSVAAASVIGVFTVLIAVAAAIAGAIASTAGLQ
jgi:hypothetical protein